MDADRFDRLSRSLSVTSSRRSTVAAALISAFSLLGLLAQAAIQVDAKSRKRPKRRDANRDRRSRRKRVRGTQHLRTEASPARERELTCSDGTVFTGEQVRQGAGRPPHTWRNVTPGAFPAAFTFHASFVTAPDGTVVEEVSFDNTQGIDRNHELVTCSFIIPIGPFTGYTADFVGFFVP